MGTFGGLLAAGPRARAGHCDVDAHGAPRHRRAGPLCVAGQGGDGRCPRDRRDSGWASPARCRPRRTDRSEPRSIPAVRGCRRLAARRRRHAGLLWAGVVRPHHRPGAGMSWAAVLLAAALLIGGRSARAGFRLDRAAAVVRRHPRPPGGAADPLAVASSLDVFAACLTSGMAVASAAAATGEFAPRHLSAVLVRAADLLALGAEPAT